jgi:hypothetical protein
VSFTGTTLNGVTAEIAGGSGNGGPGGGAGALASAPKTSSGASSEAVSTAPDKAMKLRRVFDSFNGVPLSECLQAFRSFAVKAKIRLTGSMNAGLTARLIPDSLFNSKSTSVFHAPHPSNE